MLMHSGLEAFSVLLQILMQMESEIKSLFQYFPSYLVKKMKLQESDNYKNIWKVCFRSSKMTYSAVADVLSKMLTE